MKQMVAAIETDLKLFNIPTTAKMLEALSVGHQAIAEAEKQEPVEYIKDVIEGLYENGDPVSVEAAELIDKLYTHPQPKREPVIDKSAAIRIATALGWEPKREWIGLTDEEVKKIAYNSIEVKVARAIEAKLKEKNT
jgi:hypothetical protein